MQSFEVTAMAGQISAELAKLGLDQKARVRVRVEIAEPDGMAMAAIAEADGAFQWLADEPDLYTDADLLPEE